MFVTKKRGTPSANTVHQVAAFRPESQILKTDSYLLSLLWESIKVSKLDNISTSTNCDDSPIYGEDSAPEFSLDFEQSVEEPIIPYVYQSPEPKSLKVMSKTARERKAARERKIAKLVKYEKNTKLIRTRKNQDGHGSHWISQKPQSEQGEAIIEPSPQWLEETSVPVYHSVKTADIFKLTTDDKHYRFASEDYFLEDF